MRKKHAINLAASLLVAAGVAGAVYCLLTREKRDEGARRPRRIVKVHGVESCWDAAMPVPFHWHAVATKGHPPALLLRDGDLIGVAARKDERQEPGRIIPYRETDGPSLSLDLEGSRVLVHGVTVSVALGRVWDQGEEDGLLWFMNASHRELAELRFVAIGDLGERPDPPDPEGPADPDYVEFQAVMHSLRRLSWMNPNVGLLLVGRSTLRHVLPLFHPRWLVVRETSSVLEKKDLSILSSRRGLEFLSLLGDVDPDFKKPVPDLVFLSGLADLRTLALADWRPLEMGRFPPGCAGIEKLVLFQADLDDLWPVVSLTGLRELHIAYFKEGGRPEEVACPKNIRALTRLPDLEALTMYYLVSKGTRHPDLSALKDLPRLTWLGLPAKTTRDEFTAAVRDVPGLRRLDLFWCEGIESLDPLKGLTDLGALVLFTDEKVSYRPLFDMKGLRLLVLPEGASEEPAGDESGETAHRREARELEAALPECTVTFARPLCLGSAWILALVPAAAAARLLSTRGCRRRRRRGRRRVAGVPDRP